MIFQISVIVIAIGSITAFGGNGFGDGVWSAADQHAFECALAVGVALGSTACSKKNDDEASGGGGQVKLVLQTFQNFGYDQAIKDFEAANPNIKVEHQKMGELRDFHVAGVWRDYARAAGAVIIRRADYIALTGDREAADVALWLAKGATVAQVLEGLRRLPFGAALETSVPSEIRNLTLKIFDRSFAVTYLLEGIAIVIGLFGVAATFSAIRVAA